MHTLSLPVQVFSPLLCFYAFYRQKTVCANESHFRLLNQVFLTPPVIFRIFAQNSSPLD
jgi:hypothetical protein